MVEPLLGGFRDWGEDGIALSHAPIKRRGGVGD